MGKSVKPQTHKQAFLPKSHHTRPGFNHQGLVQPWALEAKFLPKSKGVAWLPESFLNSNSKTLWWIAHPCSTHFLATRLFCFGMEKRNQKPILKSHGCFAIPTTSPQPLARLLFLFGSSPLLRCLASLPASEQGIFEKKHVVFLFTLLWKGITLNHPPTSTFFWWERRSLTVVR